VAFNYRMTDIQAAVGREQLKRLPEIVQRRRELAARYHQLLGNVRGIAIPSEPAWARSNWQSYAVRIDAALDQRLIMQRMLDDGVSTRRGVMNAHREAAYADGGYRAAPGGLARGEEAQDTAIVLPLFHLMTADEQDRVVAALKQALERG
jgi:dTDP-4-amino-4,6-dideoxygalactose transaminase